jgi:chaperonin GroES
MKLNPLNDRVVVEPIEQSSKTESGLFLPENAQEKPRTGKVLAVGMGLYQDGSRVPLVVKVGDTVLFAKYLGTEVKLDGKKTLIIRESDVLAIVAG